MIGVETAATSFRVFVCTLYLFQSSLFPHPFTSARTEGERRGRLHYRVCYKLLSCRKIVGKHTKLGD